MGCSLPAISYAISYASIVNHGQDTDDSYRQPGLDHAVFVSDLLDNSIVNSSP